MNFLRKTICFTKFPTFMNLFGHWAKNVPNFVLLCSAGPSKKQPICPEVFCDEKQKVSNVSNKGVFYNCLRITIANVCTFEKKLIVLVLQTLLYMSRGTFSEKIFVSKSSFFVRCYRALRENISDFWRSCFRQGCHHSVLLLPRKVSGKNFSEKKSFFIVSRLGAKNRLLKGHQNECENFILRVRWSFFRKKIFFSSYLIYFFWYFERKNVMFENFFRRLVKIAFCMSRGTSWWNYFCSLKTYFLWSFRASSENIFANFLGMFLETASYVGRGTFD